MALTKRDTTMLTDSSPQPAEREESGSDGSFWFEDGNIILINAQRAGFRVHLDVLSMNADFFRDTSGMTLLQERGTEYYLLRVTDSTKDLMHFFHALYTRAYFYPGKPIHYDVLESMLRLAKKYLAHQLRADIVKHLTMIYPSKMAALEERKDLRVPDHYSHSVRAIAMSREHDIPIILPAAFYFASTIPPAQLIDLHLKRDDVAVILSGRDKIAEDAFKIAWSWLFISSSGSRCSSVVQCQRRRLDVIQKLARSPGDAHRLFLNTMPHQYWQEEDKENGSESEVSGTATSKYGIGFLRTSSSLIGIKWGRIHSDWKTEDILSTNKHSYALNSGVDVNLTRLCVNLKKERVVSFRTFVHSLYYI